MESPVWAFLFLHSHYMADYITYGEAVYIFYISFVRLVRCVKPWKGSLLLTPDLETGVSGGFLSGESHTHKLQPWKGCLFPVIFPPLEAMILYCVFYFFQKINLGMMSFLVYDIKATRFHAFDSYRRCKIS